MGTATDGMVVLPYTAIGTCMPTIRIIATTGIGVTKIKPKPEQLVTSHLPRSC
jgi:hypothetical protein